MISFLTIPSASFLYVIGYIVKILLEKDSIDRSNEEMNSTSQVIMVACSN